MPLAESVSRYVSPAQSYPTTDGLTAAGLAGATGTVAVLLLVEKPEFALAAAMGTARALPAYSRKTSDSGPVAVKVLIKGATPNFLVLGQEMASSLRRAQALADAPAEEVNTSQFESAAIAAVGDVSGVSITSIVGEELLENGLNAICEPAGPAAGFAPRRAPASQREDIRVSGTFGLGGLVFQWLTTRCALAQTPSAALVSIHRGW